MNPTPESQAHPALGLATRLACAGAGAIAALTLVGWQLDLPVLRSPIPGTVAMNPLTALAFLLAGVSLWSILRTEPGARTTRLARLCAAIVAGIGAVKLFSLFTGIALPLDQVLFHDKLAGVTPPNRMAPNTALAFVLVGAGLLTLDSRAEAGRRMAETLLLATAAISLSALLGYFYAARPLYGIAAFIPMAANTALAFLLVSLAALFARPDSGLCRLVLSASPGGVMARRLLPVAVVMPIVLGWLRLWGQRAGLYELEIGTAMLILAIMGMLVGMVWLTGLNLDAADRERRRMEEALWKSLERQARLTESNLIGIMTANTRGWITEANPAFLNMIGYRREELPVRADTITPPEWRGLTVNAIRQIVERGAATPFEKEYVRKDGTRVPALVGAAASGAEGEVVAFAVDLSGKKDAERKIEELHRALKLHAEQLEVANRELEAFSYSVSHDLRAPLRHIAGFVDLLLRQSASQLDETGKRRLTAVSDSAQRMGQLIDDLLVFSRMGRTELQAARVDLNVVLQSILGELEADTRNRNIRWVLGRLPTVRGDASMLRLVLTNLVGNAIKYTGTREQAVIEIGTVDASAAAGATNGAAGTVVFVRDNGVGYDMEYAGKLFGVFQRLHRQDEFPGTGIGLANVRRIIQRHGGNTWAEGAVGEGATFYFSLPAADEIQEEERWAA